MRKLISIVFIGSILFVAYSCSATKVSKAITAAAIPTKAQVERDYTVEQINQGKTVWKNHCDRCHDLRPPEDHTRAQWNPILKKMIGKADLNMEDGTAIYAWIMANAKDD